MKYLRVILIIFILFLSGCSLKTRLTYKIVFSLPINIEDNGLKIIKSSDFFFEVPSAYLIRDNYLYIIDKFNNRMLKYNKKNDVILKITNSQKKGITLVYKGSNHILQPLYVNEKLFGFRELGNIYVKKDNIYLESILMRQEEDRINSLSLILKYDKHGIPVHIIGNRLRRSNKIFPFRNLEKFLVDKQGNIFIYLKTEEYWRVIKLNENYKTVYRFNSVDFLKKISIIPDEKKKEKVIIENIENSFKGDFLVVAVTYYKNEIEFQKIILYRIDIETDNITELFTMSNEQYIFVLVDNFNRIYIWETKEPRKDVEYITLRLYNLAGRSVVYYGMKLDRKEAQWFNIKLQKDGKVTGINIRENKFNVVVWK